MKQNTKENIKVAAKITGVLVLFPIFPFCFAADVVRNVLRQGSYPKEEQDHVMGECDITDYVERKFFGE